jgi:predicted glutamine amidotransferase
MCRMVAIVPSEGVRLDSGVIRSFRELAIKGKVKSGSAPGHPDGWGIVSWFGGRPNYLGREPTDASKDPEFRVACDKIDNLKVEAPIIAHLRKTSRGAKTRENTHPFVRDPWAFAHNGTIRRANLRSRTDSQWFFECLLKEIESAKGDVCRALFNLVAFVHEVYNYSSLTLILSDGKELFAYRDYSGSEDYYTMYYARMEDKFVVSQEKFFDARWNELGNGELLEVGQDLNPNFRSLPRL